MAAILVTGAAGFIGMSVAERLLARGDTVIGIDNLNDYYSVALKKSRLNLLSQRYGAHFRFHEIDFAAMADLENALQGQTFDGIVHLGAQAGVRFSIENPHIYMQSNMVGHLNMLEIARHRSTGHFVYASSSSVYGANKSMPFSVGDRVDHPVSLYAATKKADEMMSEVYAHLYRLPQTGLRFFTVYGPWGRPDMAMWLFTDRILSGRPIDIFNEGDMKRDFTYIDDIVTGVVACLDNPPVDDGLEKAGGSISPHHIYNIGNHKAEPLMRLVELLEDACGRKAERRFLPMQAGDVKETYADIAAIQKDLGYQPSTSIDVGIPRFVSWYKAYHGIG
ncbi:protein CapI [Sphingopyxis sp. H038]|uniref:NAD-dependent epimerase/dehydratase family protein n=1 Tax=unclassified Sphingopyxis TaxID=2614943 RepID=UPI0007311187|nr:MULTISPECIES: NAD-dependent epimerase/dehydratase family protein [unclassified Sphingopyxis]KTE01980.1 protein CapI [Sphingopyxis sp. H012]KTE09729.1 protein CapI [Sphingopyxis sp. H053]KTE15122.1 protein CapI [Sphingopyxis sp. H093]KTE29830.1 protein CapI [Sphingopyxis sp. H080]KTE32940.1 protein CapI [Sphingopyxis sp. H038]